MRPKSLLFALIALNGFASAGWSAVLSDGENTFFTGEDDAIIQEAHENLLERGDLPDLTEQEVRLAVYGAAALMKIIQQQLPELGYTGSVPVLDLVAHEIDRVRAENLSPRAIDERLAQLLGGGGAEPDDFETDLNLLDLRLSFGMEDRIIQDLLAELPSRGLTDLTDRELRSAVYSSTPLIHALREKGVDGVITLPELVKVQIGRHRGAAEFSAVPNPVPNQFPNRSTQHLVPNSSTQSLPTNPSVLPRQFPHVSTKHLVPNSSTQFLPEPPDRTQAKTEFLPTNLPEHGLNTFVQDAWTYACKLDWTNPGNIALGIAVGVVIVVAVVCESPVAAVAALVLLVSGAMKDPSSDLNTKGQQSFTLERDGETHEFLCTRKPTGEIFCSEVSG